MYFNIKHTGTHRRQIALKTVLSCRTTQKTVANGCNLLYDKTATKHHLVAANKKKYLFLKKPKCWCCAENFNRFLYTVEPL